MCVDCDARQKIQLYQWCEIKSLSIHCQLDHNNMAKVAHAANQTVKLPAVPTRDYSNFFCIFNKVSEKTAAWD